MIWLEKERYFGIPISDSGIPISDSGIPISDSGIPNSDFGKWLKVIG